MSLLSFTKKIAGRGPHEKATRSTHRKQAEKITSPKAEVVHSIGRAAGVINLTPLVTEKSVAAHGNANTVAFRVVVGATKGQVVAAIVERYKIKPRGVRSLTVNPKNRRRGNTYGRTNAWKKVYVTLPAGSTIDTSV